MKLQRYIRLCAWVFLGITALSACEGEAVPATAIIVSVKSDLDDLARIRVAVFPTDADPRSDKPEDEHVETVPATLDDLPISIVVSQGKTNEVLIAVRGLDDNGDVLAEVRTRAQFAQGKTLLLPIRLANVCRGELCEEEERQTCYLEESRGAKVGECGPIALLRDLEQIIDPVIEWDAHFPTMDAGDASLDADSAMAAETGGDADAQADSGMCRAREAGAPTCDLGGACGCEVGETCQHMAQTDGGATVACRPVGPNAKETSCTAASDCALGTTCLLGVCRKYCSADADCGSGAKCDGITFGGKDVKGVQVCYQSCVASASNVCPRDTNCTNYASGNNICVKPLNPCPSTNDRVCDEPEGTRVCAEGTDVADCSPCAPLAGQTCDLVRQCGSCTGTASACTLISQNGGVASLGCAVPGSVAREGLCSTTSDCARGSHCLNGICRKYCSTPTDCGSGYTCDGITVGGTAVSGVKLCFATCSASSSCTSGAQCTNISSEPTQWCVRPTACSGALLTNNRCDEPEGTRLCTEGSDPTDCGGGSCTPANPPSGACDLVTHCNCTSGQSCMLQMVAAATGVATVACGTPGTVAPYAACTTNSACTRGHLCVSGVCQRYCRSGVAADCDSGRTCTPIVLRGQDGGADVPVIGVNTCQ